jgi:branched-chain amino acid aminotransferase
MTADAARVVVWVDGSFVAAPTTTPAVAPLDDAVLVGAGVFETIAIRGAQPRHRRRHLDRLHASAAIVGVAVDRRTVDRGIDAVLARWEATDGRLRVTVTAGGTVIVAASPRPLIGDVAVMVTVPWPRNERSPLAGAKSTSYLENTLAFAHASSRGANEALFLNTRGAVCEGSRSNVFAVRDGRVVTPPLSAGCLAGVTRALVIEYGGAVEDTLTVDDLLSADEAFLTSALRGAQPIATIDGTHIGSAVRPHTRRVARVLAELDADA